MLPRPRILTQFCSASVKKVKLALKEKANARNFWFGEKVGNQISSAFSVPIARLLFSEHCNGQLVAQKAFWGHISIKILAVHCFSNCFCSINDNDTNASKLVYLHLSALLTLLLKSAMIKHSCKLKIN